MSMSFAASGKAQEPLISPCNISVPCRITLAPLTRVVSELECASNNEQLLPISLVIHNLKYHESELVHPPEQRTLEKKILRQNRIFRRDICGKKRVRGRSYEKLVQTICASIEINVFQSFRVSGRFAASILRISISSGGLIDPIFIPKLRE